MLTFFLSLYTFIRYQPQMGAYKYVEELYKKKQSDVLRFLLRVRLVPTQHQIPFDTEVLQPSIALLLFVKLVAERLLLEVERAASFLVGSTVGIHWLRGWMMWAWLR